MTDETKPDASGYLPILERYLRRGHVLRAFRSGGGLRVVRVEKARDSLEGYGEHPSIDHALSHAADDLLAGGRPYSEVYGGEHPHYPTGSSSPLDRHVLSGGKVRAWYRGGWFFVDLLGFASQDYPQDILDRAYRGETVHWSSPRGVFYVCTPVRFANGEAGCSIATLYKLVLRDPRHFHARARGLGETLAEAISEALAARPEEVDDAA